VSLFVFMKASRKYILYVSSKEEVSAEKRENLRRLSGTDLFVRKGDGAQDAPPGPEKVIAGDAFHGELLGEKAAEALKKVYRDILMTGQGDAGKISSVIAGLADSLLAAVAPDVGDLKSSVIKNVKNVQFMSDTAAITSLGILCALANDFKSKTAFQNISQAVVMMDASLADLEPWELETYYKNRRELPAHALEKINNHPVKSQQLVAYLPVANETVNQLILMHHELHNGKGYHRGIRTANSIPLGRVLAFAVDIYEYLRSAELNGRNVTLEQAIMSFEERGVDVHQRRHHNKVVKSVGDFLGLKMKI
jgi:hypothetical protein